LIYFIAVELHISDIEKQELSDEKDLRIKLDSNNRKRKVIMAEQNDAAYNKLVKEMNDLRGELLTLKKQVAESENEDKFETALGFVKEEFLGMSPTKSLQWVTTTLAPRLKRESCKFPLYFGALRTMAMAGEMVVWTCAGYNRGTKCQAKWHVYENPQRSSRDIRLHCCTLCYDGLGVLSEHRMVDCPWLKDSTWEEIKEEELLRSKDFGIASTSQQN
jgi:hypothetical protein